MTAATRSTPARILYFNGWGSCHGGSSTSLLDIVTHVDRDRFEPLVMCQEPGDLVDRLQDAGIRVMVRPSVTLKKSTVPSFLWETLRLRRWLRRERVSLIHANTTATRRSLGMAARLAKVPFVQHIRNPVTNVRYLTSAMLPTMIVANSDSAAVPFRDDARCHDVTRTIYNSVDLAAYSESTDCRAQLPEGKRPIIGFVAQIIPRKGLSTLIRSVKELKVKFPDILLVVVGCCPPDEPEYEKDCRELVESLGLTENVTFVGYQRNVAEWMRTFDVFVLPTRSEPFGKVVVEAMAAGTPVVATAVGGIPEIIDCDQLGTLIGPDDVPATAQAILPFLERPELAEAVGQAGAVHVKKRFSLSGMIDQIQSLYCEILGRETLSS